MSWVLERGESGVPVRMHWSPEPLTLDQREDLYRWALGNGPSPKASVFLAALEYIDRLERELARARGAM